MNIGNLLKTLRLENNLTQEEVAKRIGTSRSNIANYENENNMPSIEVLKKLSKLFNCSLDYLTGIMPYKNLQEEISVNEKIMALLDTLVPFDIDRLENLINSSFNSNGDMIKSKQYIKDNLQLDSLTQEEITFVINGLCTHYETYFYEYPTSNNKSHYFSIIAFANFLRLDIAEMNQSMSNINLNKYYMCPVYGQISAGEPNWAEENIEGRLPIDPNLMDIINPEEYFFLRVNGESMNNVVKNGAFALIHKQDMVEDGEIAVVLVNGYSATLKKFTKKGDVVVLEPDSNDPSFKTQIYDKTTPIQILGKYVGKLEINKGG